ncbi:MAG: hypothetical protein CMJ68_01775 [Planctomycetaceae bacterium]|nr:hypothetical protein [Planctomycetaceae bacterium]
MSERAKVFELERVGEVVVVAPMGDEASFRYFDIHNQANQVMRTLDDGSVRAVVVDLSHVSLLGWVMTSAIVRLVRNLDYRGGLAVYCAASAANLNQLSTMKLGRPWSHHATRNDGIEAVRQLLGDSGAIAEKES